MDEAIFVDNCIWWTGCSVHRPFGPDVLFNFVNTEEGFEDAHRTAVCKKLLTLLDEAKSGVAQKLLGNLSIQSEGGSKKRKVSED